MTKERISLIKIYKIVFIISLMIYIMRQAIPMHTLFWIMWSTLQLIGIIILFRDRKVLSITGIFNFVFLSKTFTVLLMAYIIIDIVNMTYGPDSILAMGKYIVLVEGLSYIVHAVIICNICNINPDKFLDAFYKCVTICAVFASIFAIINFFIPIFNNTPNGQISIISDYNAFCRYYIFSYIIGFVFICNKKEIMFSRRLTYISIYSVFLCIVMLMSTSRRTLITLLIFVFILIIYYIVELYKATKTVDKRKQFLKRVTVSIICFFVTGLIIVGGSNGLINAKQFFNGSEIVNGGLEQTSERFDVDNFWGKRQVIWNEAIKELKRYDGKEILLGKGSGYATQYYEKEPTATVIQELYGVNKLEENSMHTHNYLLQDMMEGGILKVLFSLLLTVGLGVKTVINIVKRGNRWIIPALSLLLIGTNIMISYSSGFIGDIYYNITLLILVQLKSCERRDNIHITKK